MAKSFLVEKVILFFKSKKYRMPMLSILGFYRNMSDEEYLKKLYKAKTGKKLNLQNPITFNEKLQWLKLYDRNPEYAKMVDKYEVRNYIAEKIGEEYLIPLLGVWNSFDEIDFDKLPNQFVLKCTHDSGGIVICKDKSQFNITAARKKINRRLKRDYFWQNREWPYKNVKPRIIAEKYMIDESETELKDYKFMCFGGEPKCCFVCTERTIGQSSKIIIYDKEWKKMPVGRGFIYDDEIAKPKSYEKMLEIAKLLSRDMTFVRIDLYDINGKIYFGEITFFPASGFSPFYPEEWDLKFGEWIKLN